MDRFSPQPHRQPDTVPFHIAARMVLATVGPWKVPSPAAAAHTSKGDTWTLYKNHKRFCTRTWGHGGESLPSPLRGEHRSPYPPRDTIHIFDVLKTNQAQTHSTCRGAAAPAPPGRTRGSGSHSGTSQ